MDPIVLFLVVSQVVLAAFVLVRTRAAGVSRRLLTLERIAAASVAHARGRSLQGPEFLWAAMDCARHMDANDNGVTKRGVRAFSDAELRNAIDAHKP